MLNRLKSAGQTAAGFALAVGLATMGLVIAWGVIKGAAWLVANTLEWVVFVAGLVFAVDVLVLLPMAMFRRTRPHSAVGLLVSSYIFGVTTWFYGFIFTYGLWGGFAVVIGLCMFGVGVVLMGVLATAFRGMWDASLTLLVMVVMTFGIRFFSVWLGDRHDATVAKAMLEHERASLT